MTAKEKYKSIMAVLKAAFDITDPATPAAPADTSTATVFSYPIDNGATIYVDCSDDGVAGIDANDKVYSDPALTVPYADGTYNVTGTTFGFTVAGGAVTVVTDTAGTGPGLPLEQSGAADPATQDMGKTPPAAAAPPAAPATPPPGTSMAEMTPESAGKFLAAFATGTPEERIANLELVAKALMEYNFGWQIREAQQKATTDQAINIYKTDLATAQAQLATAKTAMAKQELQLKALFTAVEEMATIPSADPKTIPDSQKAKFDKTQSREDRLKAISENLIKSKKK